MSYTLSSIPHDGFAPFRFKQGLHRHRCARFRVAQSTIQRIESNRALQLWALIKPDEPNYGHPALTQTVTINWYWLSLPTLATQGAPNGAVSKRLRSWLGLPTCFTNWQASNSSLIQLSRLNRAFAFCSITLIENFWKYFQKFLRNLYKKPWKILDFSSLHILLLPLNFFYKKLYSIILHFIAKNSGI